MQTLDDDGQRGIGEDEEHLDSLDDDYQQSTTTTTAALHHNNSNIDFNNNNNNNSIEQEPGGWSMSLTADGLVIQAVTRNLYEFNEFAKTISRQMIRDFGVNYLPKNWDPDAEGYYDQLEEEEVEEAEGQVDVLDEDEYLVTVPVISTLELLFNGKKVEEKAIVDDEEEVDLNALIESQLDNMLKYLEFQYQSIEKESSASHHFIVLMLELKSFVPLQQEQHHALTPIYIIAAYLASKSLLPPNEEEDTTNTEESSKQQCLHYVELSIIDYVLTSTAMHSEQLYPIITCLILLSWIHIKGNSDSNRISRLIFIASRLLLLSSRSTRNHQIITASLIYLDGYYSTFKFKELQLQGESSVELLKSIKSTKSEDFTKEGIVIILEAKLMSLLNKVISLFYQQQDMHEQERKIDVDEVLTLVRDVELWEQELPNCLKWSTLIDKLQAHVHMIYNIVKILLFRPFSTPSNKELDQTLTKTTFLDMSILSADKLSICLLYTIEDQEWIQSGNNLIQELFKRVLNIFDKDQDIINQLEVIKRRLPR